MQKTHNTYTSTPTERQAKTQIEHLSSIITTTNHQSERYRQGRQAERERERQGVGDGEEIKPCNQQTNQPFYSTTQLINRSNVGDQQNKLSTHCSIFSEEPGYMEWIAYGIS